MATMVTRHLVRELSDVGGLEDWSVENQIVTEATLEAIEATIQMSSITQSYYWVSGLQQGGYHSQAFNRRIFEVNIITTSKEFKILF